MASAFYGGKEVELVEQELLRDIGMKMTRHG